MSDHETRPMRHRGITQFWWRRRNGPGYSRPQARRLWERMTRRWVRMAFLEAANAEAQAAQRKARQITRRSGK